MKVFDQYTGSEENKLDLLFPRNSTSHSETLVETKGPNVKWGIPLSVDEANLHMFSSVLC